MSPEQAPFPQVPTSSFKATINTIEVRQYQTGDGHTAFAEWMAKLPDPKANRAIVARIRCMQTGNRGD